jgi:hypothetical protein
VAAPSAPRRRAPARPAPAAEPRHAAAASTAPPPRPASPQPRPRTSLSSTRLDSFPAGDNSNAPDPPPWRATRPAMSASFRAHVSVFVVRVLLLPALSTREGGAWWGSRCSRAQVGPVGRSALTCRRGCFRRLGDSVGLAEEGPTTARWHGWNVPQTSPIGWHSPSQPPFLRGAPRLGRPNGVIEDWVDLIYPRPHPLGCHDQGEVSVAMRASRCGSPGCDRPLPGRRWGWLVGRDVGDRDDHGGERAAVAPRGVGRDFLG